MSCLKCHSSGWVVATSKKNNALFAFICSCGIGNARGLSSKIPVWSDRFFRDYLTDFDAPAKPDFRKITANQGKNDDDSNDLPF